MSNLIDRPTAVNELIAMREHIDASMSIVGSIAYDMAIEALRQPEIICCEDCKYAKVGKPIADGRYWCELHYSYMYYCSDAERRTDERPDLQTGGELRTKYD